MMRKLVSQTILFATIAALAMTAAGCNQYSGLKAKRTFRDANGMYQASDLPGYPFNLDKAKQLMKDSSAPNGFTLDMQVRSGNTDFANVATIVKDEWSKIGVTVNIQNLETMLRFAYRVLG